MHTKEHDSDPEKPKYRPLFMDHFDRKPNVTANVAHIIAEGPPVVDNRAPVIPSAPPAEQITPTSAEVQQAEEERQRYQSHLQLQLNQISAANAAGMQQMLHHQMGQPVDNVINLQMRNFENPMKYQRNFVDGDFEFVS